MTEKNILFINACVRPSSRTLILARHVLRHLSGAVEEVDLQHTGLLPLNRESLSKRDAMLAAGDYENPMLYHARTFAQADEIMIAAPYWDLSFPACVKIYFEHVTVNGVTFTYGEDGIPVGLCRARRLYYVMTAGGPVLQPDYGRGYVESLASLFYGIPETVCFSASMLDVAGTDVTSVLEDTKQKIDRFFQEQ